MKITNAFLILAASGIIIGACQKTTDTTGVLPEGKEISNDLVLMDELEEELFNDLIDLDNWWLYGTKQGGDDCRIVTVEPEDRTIWPKTITIDFGEGCEVREGVVKKGKIVIRQSAPAHSDTWRKRVEFVRYQVNDDRIAGYQTFGFSREGRAPSWHTSTDMTITLAEGTEIKRAGQHLRQQIAGTETPRERTDDVFRLTGESSGTGREGKSYHSVITEPLIAPNACRWITKGVKEITVGEESTSVLDYGDGTCDNQATVTRDGETVTITLRGRR